MPPWIGNKGRLQDPCRPVIGEEGRKREMVECLGDCEISGDGFDHVTKLHLDFNMLKGVVPESIGSLTYLRSLDLSTNEIHGDLPEKALGSLVNLQFLDVSYNRLENVWTGNLLHLSAIRELHLGFNDIVGQIEELLEAYPKLEVLSLQGNRYFEGDMSSAAVKDAFRRNGSLARTLQKLDLTWNSIGGSIPKEIGNLASLKFLSLAKNMLTGTLEEEGVGGGAFGADSSLRNLEVLDLQANEIRGSIPQAIVSALPSLKVLRLNGNRFSGAIPEGLLTQSNAREGGGGEEGSSDKSSGRLRARSKLVEIDLSGNFLTSIDPMWLSRPGDCDTLRSLDLSNNPFQNIAFYAPPPEDSPSPLSQATLEPCADTLEHVRLAAANISGEIPHATLALPRLLSLDLHANRIVGRGPLPHTLLRGASSKLRYLALHNNHLSGEIPRDWLENLPHLTVLTLHSNQLSGRIPHDFGEARANTRLEVLTLHQNLIEGDPRTVMDPAQGRCEDLHTGQRGSAVHPTVFVSLLRLLGSVTHDSWDAAYAAAIVAHRSFRTGDCAGERAKKWAAREREKGWKKRESPPGSSFGEHILDFQTQSRYPDMYIAREEGKRKKKKERKEKCSIQNWGKWQGNKTNSSMVAKFGAAMSYAASRDGLQGEAYRDGPHPETFMLPRLSAFLLLGDAAAEIAKSRGEHEDGEGEFEVSAQALLERLQEKGTIANVEKVWEDIEAAMAKSLIVATDRMAAEERKQISRDSSVYEVLGFDVLLDESGKPWVCEVNTAPNMGLEVNRGGDQDVEEEDRQMKHSIMKAVLAVAGVQPRRQGVSVPLNIADWQAEVPCVSFVLNKLDALGAQLAADGEICEGGELQSSDAAVQTETNDRESSFGCFTEFDFANLIDFECELQTLEVSARRRRR
eukprot:jgi/Bigna1/66844/fgenesh1_pg.2_\